MVPDTSETPCVGHLLSPWDYHNLSLGSYKLSSSSFSLRKDFAAKKRTAGSYSLKKNLVTANFPWIMNSAKSGETEEKNYESVQESKLRIASVMILCSHCLHSFLFLGGGGVNVTSDCFQKELEVHQKTKQRANYEKPTESSLTFCFSPGVALSSIVRKWVYCEHYEAALSFQ